MELDIIIPIKEAKYADQLEITINSYLIKKKKMNKGAVPS